MQAYIDARDDDRLKKTTFDNPVGTDVDSAESRALTCPRLRDTLDNNDKGQKRKFDDGAAAGAPPPAGKKTKAQKRADAAARRAAAAAPTPPPPTANPTDDPRLPEGGRVGGDRGPPPPRAGKGRKAVGKGAGAGGPTPKGAPAGAKAMNNKNERICFAYNTGGCSRGANCAFKHQCWFFFKGDCKSGSKCGKGGA